MHIYFPDQWTVNDIEANGVRIHYTRTGDGSKPPLVLLHGFSDNGLCWLPVALGLQENWDVILPDARGHGLSQRVQPGECVDSPADIAGLISALELNGPIVGGHSMGAGTASQLEARFPGLARALVLEDPAWRLPEPPPPDQKENDEKRSSPRPFPDWLSSLRGKRYDELVAKCRQDSPAWPEIELQPWAEAKLQLDPNITAIAGVRMDWQEAASRIHCPALLITADPERGAIVTPEAARRAQELSESIRVARIPSAGHSIRRENYPVYMQAVREFLAQNRG